MGFVLTLLLRLIRYAFLGAFLAAIAAKLSLRSKAESDIQEIDLVAIFEGNTLLSTADPFYGGKTLTMFAGTLLDLRKVTPAPTGIHLDVIVIMGGLTLLIPEGWKVDFTGDVIGGGIDDATPADTDPDATVVRVTGKIILGGFQATTRAPVEAVA